MLTEWFKLGGAALFLFAVAALFWEWAFYLAIGSLLVVAGLWIAEVYLRHRESGTPEEP
jgi:hypothetical protein